MVVPPPIAIPVDDESRAFHGFYHAPGLGVNPLAARPLRGQEFDVGVEAAVSVGGRVLREVVAQEVETSYLGLLAAAGADLRRADAGFSLFSSSSYSSRQSPKFR